MSKRSGKNIIRNQSVNIDQSPISINPQSQNTKTAKKATAAFIGSYNYMQPGRSTQYDIGTDNYNGLTDIPVYIALMNEKNGGCLYFPTNLKQKYSYYRYFYRADAYVGAAIDLHTDLPMSKLSLKMPPMVNQKRRQYIKKKYQHMVQSLDLYSKLRDILFQFWLIGNCYCYLQYNPKIKQFDKLVILPPQDCNVTNYPFSNQSVIAYNQQQIIQLVKRLKSLSSDYSGVSAYLNDDIYTSTLSQMDKRILQNIPQQLLQHVFKNQTILFDTDPYAGGSLGSFAFIVTRRKHSYATLGASLLQRVFVPLMQKVHYTYTQWALASRNMTPRNKLTAPQINPQQLDQLRQQFDASMNMPQYAIVTNYDWNWQIIGADNRLIDLGRQYQVIQNQIFAGLGVTRQILSGQGMYSSGHINVQIMNARYLLVRDQFKKMVQDKIFKPIAEQNGFYDVDQDGFKHYYYPKLSFERLSIIDNDQNFDKLFQLYQKGSLPIGYIYEILNIDEEQATQKLKKDMFTVKDSTFNEMIRQSYSRIGDNLIQNSNLDQLLAQNLFVNGKQVQFKKAQDGEGGGDSDNPFDLGDDSSSDDSGSDNPFDLGDDSSQDSSSQQQNDNPFDLEEQEQKKDKTQDKVENNLVELSDQDFEQFLKTQQLVVQDQDIKQFLKMQNKYVVKNKQIKQFLNDYFLRPTNKDVDAFIGLIDNQLHPTNKMFENFLETLNIQRPTNKQVEQFLKMFFLKPTNKQIEQFLKRYGKYQVSDQQMQEFLQKNNEEQNQVVSDQDIQQFIESQQSENVDLNDVDNFQLSNENKFKL